MDIAIWDVVLLEKLSACLNNGDIGYKERAELVLRSAYAYVLTSRSAQKVFIVGVLLKLKTLLLASMFCITCQNPAL